MFVGKCNPLRVFSTEFVQNGKIHGFTVLGVDNSGKWVYTTHIETKQQHILEERSTDL